MSYSMKIDIFGITDALLVTVDTLKTLGALCYETSTGC
jgi:hypothetical protein